MKVKFQTSAGVFVVELFDKMPRSSERFIGFVRDKLYEGTHFHRVVPGAMVVGGDPLSKDLANEAIGTGGSPLGAFADEHVAQISNDVGTIGFCTQNRVDSADCQFYVNLAKNDHLDWWKGGGHAPFAKVVDGLQVVRTIAAGPNNGRIVGERPKKPVKVIAVSLL
jgi:cyclophilin family peptidyl-prolyl cis-trans isomerase